MDIAQLSKVQLPNLENANQDTLNINSKQKNMKDQKKLEIVFTSESKLEQIEILKQFAIENNIKDYLKIELVIKSCEGSFKTFHNNLVKKLKQLKVTKYFIINKEWRRLENVASNSNYWLVEYELAVNYY